MGIRWLCQSWAKRHDFQAEGSKPSPTDPWFRTNTNAAHLRYLVPELGSPSGTKSCVALGLKGSDLGLSAFRS